MPPAVVVAAVVAVAEQNWSWLAEVVVAAVAAAASIAGDNNIDEIAVVVRFGIGPGFVIDPVPEIRKTVYIVAVA